MHMCINKCKEKCSGVVPHTFSLPAGEVGTGRSLGPCQTYLLSKLKAKERPLPKNKVDNTQGAALTSGLHAFPCLHTHRAILTTHIDKYTNTKEIGERKLTCGKYSWKGTRVSNSSL